MSNTKHAKVIVLGSGPAGYTAALYAARANLEPLLITGMEQGGQLMTTTEIDNWPADVNGVQGPELMQRFLDHANRFGTQIEFDMVTEAHLKEKPIRLVSDLGNTYTCDALIIATGASAKYLGLESEQHYKGRGVSACATCDGFFYRKKKIAVIGNGSYAYHEASYLSNLTNDLTVLTGANPINDERLHEFNLIEDKIDTVLGEDRVSGIRFEYGNELEFDGIFIALGVAGSVDLAKNMGILISGNKIETDENFMTNIEGIFAVGDATKGMAQIAKAVYDGAVAANAVLVLFNRK